MKYFSVWSTTVTVVTLLYNGMDIRFHSVHLFENLHEISWFVTLLSTQKHNISWAACPGKTKHGIVTFISFITNLNKTKSVQKKTISM